ncbi:hypothetical protein TNCV_3996211 [Trichonephila clavipes]|nr:hypothetical protein TNCV_3996211 [Trichonephila clavipes]
MTPEMYPTTFKFSTMTMGSLEASVDLTVHQPFQMVDLQSSQGSSDINNTDHYHFSYGEETHKHIRTAPQRKYTYGSCSRLQDEGQRARGWIFQKSRYLYQAGNESSKNMICVDG